MRVSIEVEDWRDVAETGESSGDGTCRRWGIDALARFERGEYLIVRGGEVERTGRSFRTSSVVFWAASFMSFVTSLVWVYEEGESAFLSATSEASRKGVGCS